MDTLRKPFFIAALVLMVLVVLLEVGSLGVVGGDAAQLSDLQGMIPEGEVQDAFDDMDDDEREELADLAGQDKPPGIGITYMALLDGVLLFTVGLVGASLLLPERVHAKAQGCATLIFSILIVLGGIVLIFAALALVILMVSLLLSVPFGTLAYLALYGFFNRGGANTALGFLMALKIGFAVCLILGQQRFLQNRGLVLLIISSFLANVIISFLHGFVPGFLVSITDGVAAIIVALCGVIWALLLLIGSLPAIVKALRLDRG